MIQEYRESYFNQGKTRDRKEDANTLPILPPTGLSQGGGFQQGCSGRHLMFVSNQLLCLVQLLAGHNKSLIFPLSPFLSHFLFTHSFCPEISFFNKEQHIRDSVSQGTPAKAKGADALPALSNWDSIGGMLSSGFIALKIKHVEESCLCVLLYHQLQQ